jgi:hypothetical protein
MADANWALVLNLHQPSDNIEAMTTDQEWQAKEILWAMDRIPRSLWAYEDIGRVHLCLSGTLLESLSDPGFQRRFYGVIDCGSLLWHLQNTRIITVLGTGYYHPVFPLIPESDWGDHLSRWKGLAQHLFNRDGFGGFWPPEMGFAMEMIPHLARHGYRYVLVDSEHVHPVESMRWEELMYRPHLARHGGEEIVVIVRDRELSNAQEAGMELGWFEAEIAARTRHCDFRPLVTTATDGENGGWFRNTGENFWSLLHTPLMDRIRAGESGIHPTFIDDHLDEYGVFGEVVVDEGAWNTGWHHGRGFTQWTGSGAQKAALARAARVSAAIRTKRAGTDPESAGRGLLAQAQWHLLRAETSCNFFWGESWLHHCDQDLDEAERLLSGSLPLPV